MTNRIPYTIYVHIVEARDLQTTSGPGALADPYVLVSCAGRAQRTEITRNQLNIFWDRIFVFPDVRLSAEEFERENIHIQIFNANVIFRNELIGQYSYGFKKVWSQPDPHKHQIHKRWVVLINPDRPEIEQGYMLATITVLGPGDQPPSMKIEDVTDPEVIRPPTSSIQNRRGYNLLFRIYRGEDALKVQRDGVDGFISVKFNGLSMKTEPDYGTTSPEWNTLLTFPVYTPCLTDNIDVQLWDYEGRGPDKLLATSTINFSYVLSNKISPTWFNFYKVPQNELPWFGRSPRVNKVQQTEFAGRVLMSLAAVITETPERSEKAQKPVQPPQSCEYILHVDVYQTSPLVGVGGFFSWEDVKVEMLFGPHKRRSVTGRRKLGADGKLQGYEFAVEGRDSEGGERTEFGKCQFKSVRCQLPRVTEKDTKMQWDQLYDVILNVYDGDSNRIGLVRFDAQSLIRKTDTQMLSKPEWHPIRGLEEDGAVRTRGFILFHAALRALKRGESSPPRPQMDSPVMAKHYVRAHIYMAKELSAVNSNGLSSPFVRVSLGGTHLGLLAPHKRDEEDPEKWKPTTQENAEQAVKMLELEGRKQTSTVENTLNPVWMQTLYAEVELPKIEGADASMSLSLAPDVVLTVYNEGQSEEEYIGRCSYPAVLCEEERWAGQNPSTGKKEPVWLELRKDDLSGTYEKLVDKEDEKTGAYAGGRKSEGKILVWFEIVDEDKFDVDDDELDGGHEWPELQSARIQLVSLGLRNLIKLGGYPATNPEFELIVPNFPDRRKERSLRRELEDREAETTDEEGDDDHSNESSDDEHSGNGLGSSSDETDSDEEDNQTKAKMQYHLDHLLGTKMVWSSKDLKEKSKLPSNSSPYHYTDIVLEVKAPRDAFYCGALTVLVKEEGMFGEEIIASRDIPLAKYAVNEMYDAVNKGRATVVVETRVKEFWHMETAFRKDNDDEGDTKGGGGPVIQELDDDGDDEGGDGAGPPSEITPEIRLDADDINMVFEKELTAYKEEGESSLEESSDGGREESVFWPGDFDDEGDNLGRQNFSNALEDVNFLHPVYGTWELYAGNNQNETGRGKNVSNRTVGKLKGVLKMWSASNPFYTDSSGQHHAYATMPKAPDWFNCLESKANGKERNPKNVWLADMDARKVGENDGTTEIVKVRIYVLNAYNLAPLASGNSSNPFIAVQMHDRGEVDRIMASGFEGHFDFSDDNNYKPNTLNPEFNWWHELDGILPSITTLEVALYDHGYITDTLIGRTYIDLEDRWFDQEWRKLRDVQQIPRENRVLLNDNSIVPQGKMEMWVEMYEPKKSIDIPIVPIESPQVTEWELRLVVWETRKVPKLPDKRSTNMYVSAELLYFTADGEQGAKQVFETDVHDGVRGGDGKFNWRMKFRVPIPCKNPRIRVQVHDYAMFGVDGFIAESIINLHQIFKEALHTQAEVAKSKSYFRLSSSSFPGETRGEVDLQMNILPLKDAEKNPVGAARDKPNDDPFLPEPVRKVRSFFNSNFMYYVKIVFFVGILAGVIFFTVVGTNVNNQKQA
jgi:hypothetical protein